MRLKMSPNKVAILGFITFSGMGASRCLIRAPGKPTLWHPGASELILSEINNISYNPTPAKHNSINGERNVFN